MKNITNYKTKEIECDDCGRVSTVAKHIPLRFAKCPECGSLHIRLHKDYQTDSRFIHCIYCGGAMPNHVPSCVVLQKRTSC